MPDITVAGLSKAFGQGRTQGQAQGRTQGRAQGRALSDVSFSVRDKEFLTLLGPSGCGKTTTLMSIAGGFSVIARGFSIPDTAPG